MLYPLLRGLICGFAGSGAYRLALVRGFGWDAVSTAGAGGSVSWSWWAARAVVIR